MTVQNLTSLHTSAWRVFWENGGGFVTMADTPFEAFWFIQLYKFGSAVRRGGVVHDLEGPWFVDMTPWPDLHWDMNLQQTYVFPMTSNRVELSATLVDYMYGLHTSHALADNVPLAWQGDSAAAPTGASSLGANETCYWNYGAGCKSTPPSITGNLLWALQVVSLQWERHCADRCRVSYAARCAQFFTSTFTFRLHSAPSTLAPPDQTQITT